METTCMAKTIYEDMLSFRDTYSYQEVKNIVCNADIDAISKLLEESCKCGVIRDTELLLSIAKAEGLQISINNSLIYAIANHHNAIVKLLLKNGADCTYNYYEPFITCAHYNNIRAYDLLAQRGDINFNNDELLYLCVDYNCDVILDRWLSAQNTPVDKYVIACILDDIEYYNRPELMNVIKKYYDDDGMPRNVEETMNLKTSYKSYSSDNIMTQPDSPDHEYYSS